MAKQFSVSKQTVETIIHKDLRAKLKQNTRVHLLTAAHKQNRKANARKLYERHLVGDRSEYMITLDEAYFYLDNCNGTRKILYVRPGQNVTDDRLVK